MTLFTIIGLAIAVGIGLYLILLGRGFADMPSGLSGRKSVAVIGALIMFLGIDISILWLRAGPGYSPGQAVRISSVDLVAQTLAYMMRMRLDFPVKVGDVLQLEDVGADKGAVIYSMKILAQGPDEFSQLLAQVSKDLNDNGCKRKEYRKMMNFGLSIEFLFKSPTGMQGAPILLTPANCGIGI